MSFFTSSNDDNYESPSAMIFPRQLKPVESDAKELECHFGNLTMSKFGSNTSILEETTRFETAKFEEEASDIDVDYKDEVSLPVLMSGEMKISNINASFRMNINFDLKKLAQHLKNASFYNSKEAKTLSGKKFQSDRIEINLKSPKVSCFVYSNGKAYILKATS